MNLNAPELVVIGHVLNETIEFPTTTTKLAGVLGGPAAYISVIAARLGVQVGLITVVGDDVSGKLLDPIYRSGMDTRGIKRTGHSTTTNVLRYNRAGEKELLFLKKAPRITVADVPDCFWPAQLFCLCPVDYEVTADLLECLRREGKTVMADLGGFGGAASDRRKQPAEPDSRVRDVTNVIRRSDIAKASSEDCRYLFGRVVGPDHLVHLGSQVGIITKGSAGADVATRVASAPITVPAMTDRPVDVTGAGDAFTAGFLANYLQQGDPIRASAYGCATSALVIERTGGVRLDRMPTAQEVAIRVESLGKTFES